MARCPFLSNLWLDSLLLNSAALLLTEVSGTNLICPQPQVIFNHKLQSMTLLLSQAFVEQYKQTIAFNAHYCFLIPSLECKTSLSRTRSISHHCNVMILFGKALMSPELKLVRAFKAESCQSRPECWECRSCHSDCLSFSSHQSYQLSTLLSQVRSLYFWLSRSNFDLCLACVCDQIHMQKVVAMAVWHCKFAWSDWRSCWIYCRLLV